MVGLAACCSKANEQARLAERKLCFILDAGIVGIGVGDVYLKMVPTTDKRGLRALIDGGRGSGVGTEEAGLHAETAQSALTAVSKLVIRV